MKLRNLHKLILLSFLAVAGLYIASCANETSTAGKAKTPTEAYEQLFNAVKSKNTENIKRVMSKATLSFAEGVAGQQKKEVSKVLENGFHRSTMTDKLPPMRDERVKDKWGAVEVYIQKESKWEDVRFVMEDGGWKLAIGETWNGSYKSPGKSRSIRERENANAAGNGDLVPYGNGNLNTNVKPIVIDPMKGKKVK
ncbi:MAG: hypothetical protein OEM82_04040 [Acidobacteriota bacterium]|nr:hypothetical protein [Acidobacteriota bacterium]MDH3530384.1 hypothetical protein [Acidobacteriota bacterium]